MNHHILLNIFKPFLLHHSRENCLTFEWRFVGAPFEGFWFENEVMIFSKGPAPGSKFKTFGWGRTLWLVPQSYNQLVSTGVSSNSLPLPSSQGSTKCACRKDAPHSGLPATEEMVRSSYSLIDMEIWTGFPWKVVPRLSSQLLQVIPVKKLRWSHHLFDLRFEMSVRTQYSLSFVTHIIFEMNFG